MTEPTPVPFGIQLVRAARYVLHRRWRGLDPEMVYAYLRLVAAELERLLAEAAAARTEADRLRQWQDRHIGCRYAPPSSCSAVCSDQQHPEQTEPDQPPRNGGHW